MAAPLLTSNSVLLCPHGGQALPAAAAAASRIRIDGAASVPAGTFYTVVGCSLPPSAGGPCMSATLVAISDRVRSGDVGLLSADSPGSCQPTGAPLLIDAAQARVSGG